MKRNRKKEIDVTKYLNDMNKYEITCFDLDTQQDLTKAKGMIQIRAFTEDVKEFCEYTVPDMLNYFLSSNGSKKKVEDYGITMTD